MATYLDFTSTLTTPGMITLTSAYTAPTTSKPSTEALFSYRLIASQNIVIVCTLPEYYEFLQPLVYGTVTWKRNVVNASPLVTFTNHPIDKSADHSSCFIHRNRSGLLDLDISIPYATFTYTFTNDTNFALYWLSGVTQFCSINPALSG